MRKENVWHRTRWGNICDIIQMGEGFRNNDKVKKKKNIYVSGKKKIKKELE